ncbi:alpha/beta fold hydrolase [Geomicrobium sp. JCM 19038]|uniref:alpha/beta fold hydrolase n=1 Tax=Geomicrobium sp. JCM 19038 TaxID=1460635 RepID=UPI00045F2C48|nr:alpha/beta hydrolase [Geomicrobium sp. JCM 19038]GAK08336.1 hypothetical protein JCM19038_2117 [Geomicrobium sp. JCM 19038]
MRKIKIFAMIVTVGFIVIIVGIRLLHLVASDNERERFPAPGDVVHINDANMHVYSEGKGENTIVFMSGGGTQAPTIDFKPLWSLLTDEYRIAVVEKPGYGWSEESDSPRTVENMVAEMREALRLSGHTPPYVLAPHSMSGLEALYFASVYPEEVQAIVGLDPAVPKSYEQLQVPSSLKIAGSGALSDFGGLRILPLFVKEADIFSTEYLSTEDTEAYKSFIHRGTMTKNMREEIERVHENAAVVSKHIPKETPMLFFASNGQGTGIDDWRETLNEYLHEITINEFIEIDRSHYIHVYEPEQIAEEMKRFLHRLDEES